jgi:hypothetical protein
MEILPGKPWKIAENRTLKWGSSPPRAEGPPKGHALKHFLRASQSCLNIIFISRPVDSPRTTYAASCPTKTCISRLVTLHAAKIAGLPKTNFPENSVACGPLCTFLCFCDPAIHSKFDAEAVKRNFRQFLFKRVFFSDLKLEPQSLTRLIPLPDACQGVTNNIKVISISQRLTP